MKRTLFIIYLVVLGFPFILGAAVNLYVSPTGSDYNDGSKKKPFATLQMAQRKARELRRLKDESVKGGIDIVVQDGIYTLNEPVFFRPEDSGTADSPTIVRAERGAHPVFSGGRPVTGWKKAGTVEGLPAVAQGNVWVADAPREGGRIFEFRQMWVDNNKAIRANTMNDGDLPRILSVDNLNETFMIPTPSQPIHNVSQLEFFIHQWWAIAILRVKDIEIEGDVAKISFCQPESRIEFEHPWPAPFIDVNKDQNGNSAYYLTNDIGLLNSPGEWFLDLDAGKVYYWPRDVEVLSKVNIVVPYLETLVYVDGTLDNPVSHVQFQGIGFEHTTWMRPSLKGHVPLQAGYSLLDAYKLSVPGTPDKEWLENQAWVERQPAGVTLRNANNIFIGRCSFEHMAATAIDFVSGTHHNLIQGNIIRDVGGTGLQMGYYGDRSFEAHLPYDPTDERVVCRFETIVNNLITDCTNEDWGCVGIGVGYAHDITIEHNEISYLNYSGISIGWGWTRTISCMKNNRVSKNNIHHFAQNNYDVGGVYTLSGQPNTEISENSIHHLLDAPYTHDPNHYQYIYYDEGSSFIRALNNWSEKDKFFSNNPGPGNEWKNNGPDVSTKIKRNAGLEPEFLDLLKKKQLPL